MAEKKVSFGEISKKLGERAKKAVKEIADQPIRTGIVKLPPGINSGVAQVQTVGFYLYGKDTKKERKPGVKAVGLPYFRAMAVVHEPKSIVQDGNTVPVAGCQTSIMVDLFDMTRTGGKEYTLEEGVEKVRDLLGGMLGEEAVMGLEFDEFESLLPIIEAEKPFIRFSTTQGKKTQPGREPATFENWHGRKGLEDWNSGTRGEADPEGDETEEVEEKPAKVSKPAKVEKPSNKSKTKPAPEPEPEEEAFDEFGDIDSLVALAEEGDTDKLEALLEKHGINHEDYDSWADAAAAINADEEKVDDDTEEAEEPEVSVSVGDVVKYKFKGKIHKCKVKAVNDDGTVGLVSLSDKAAKMGSVEIDKLILE